MKKILKVMITSLLIIITISTMFFLTKKTEKVIKNQKSEETNFITMMIENENGKYVEKVDNNFPSYEYVFNPEKSGCENEGTLTWNSESQKIEASLITSDKCYAYFDIYSLEKYCNYIKNNNLECEILKNKDNSLIYHDGNADYPEETNYNLEAEDNSYRYAGADVDNYICFGGDCSSDSNAESYSNLYRIIGLFDDDKDGYYSIKIIKADYATTKELGTEGTFDQLYSQVETSNNTYYKGDKNNFYNKVAMYMWSSISSYFAYWKESSLNTDNLNSYFLNTLKTDNNKWNDMIEEHIWSIAGNSGDKIVGFLYDNNTGFTWLDNQTAKMAYDAEIKNSNIGTNLPPSTQMDSTIKTKIGLIYVSDYYYGASPKYWSLAGSRLDNNDYHTALNDNWLSMGLSEWTITRENSSAYAAFYISDIGSTSLTGYKGSYAIRPTMYLKPNVKFFSGDGTKTNPYRLSI